MEIVEDRNEYIDYCKKYDSSLPLFYKAIWLDTVCSSSWRPMLLEIEGEIKAIFPYFIKKKIGLSVVAMPPLTPYLAMWIFDEKNLSHYDNYLLKFVSNLPNFIFASVSSHVSYNYKECWLKSGFDLKERNTYRFESKSYEDIYKNYDSKMKNDLKYAAERVDVIEQNDVSDLYTVITKTFESQNKKVPFENNLVDRIHKNKNIPSRVISGVVDGKIIASIMVVEDNTCVYYLLSGRSTEAPRGSIALLLNHAINKAMNEGKNFDFEGSSIPAIAAFFKSFGANHHTFIHASKYRYKWLRHIVNK